jgi:hypothetical protein
MKNAFTLIALIIGAGLLYNVFLLMRHIYNQCRYRKVVTCPDTQSLAEVTLRAGWAAITATVGKPRLRVRSCSQWPGKKECAQKCIQENWLGD